MQADRPLLQDPLRQRRQLCRHPAPEKPFAITRPGLVSDILLRVSKPMGYSRRRFCLATLLAGCALPVRRLSGAGPAGEIAFKSGLQAWMETLYPSDAVSPGAGRLDVHEALIEKVLPIPDYIGLLKFGVRWADVAAKQLGKETFAALDAGSREIVVAEAEANGLDGLPGLFFHHTRLDGAEIYYSRKESWAGLAISRPPQPIGYPFHTLAPE